jgi:hypothetical protein
VLADEGDELGPREDDHDGSLQIRT